MSGWIKLQRDIMDHWIAQDNEYLAVWIRMLSEANYEPQTRMFNGQVITVDRGQFIFGLDSYAEKTKVSVMRLRRLIELLEKHHMINRVKKSKYSLISIVNYDKYQSDNRQITSTEQPENNHGTITEQAGNNTIRSKEIKEGKEGNNLPAEKSEKFTPPTVQDVYQYMGEICKGSFSEAERFCDFYSSKGWMVGRNKMKNWKASVRNWTKDQKPATPQKGATRENLIHGYQEFLNEY